MSLPPTEAAVTIVAFGFKHGIPQDLNLLFDVRFLRNPNYVAELEPLRGEAPAIARYIEDDPAAKPFLERLFTLVDFVLPRLLAAQRSQVTIGIGCTGGRHRSVYVADRLRAHLQSKRAATITMTTRDCAA